jgi:protein-S-isoprenylcysteine O-methyltransferase Ste14
MSRYARWAQTERGEATRIATLTLVAGPVFLGLLPFLVAGVGPRLDRRLGLPSPGIGRANCVLGGLLTVLGFSLGFWSVDTQLTRGRGTPLPVMPTQELLTEGPFRYCRNPMTLGTILAYLGIAVASFLHAFDPSILVFGGGVSSAGPLLFEPFLASLKQRVFHPRYLEGLKIERAALGDDAGLLGALALAQISMPV